MLHLLVNGQIDIRTGLRLNVDAAAGVDLMTPPVFEAHFQAGRSLQIGIHPQFGTRAADPLAVGKADHMCAEGSLGIITHGGFFKDHPFELHRHQRLQRFLAHITLNAHILAFRLIKQFPNLGTAERNHFGHRLANLLDVSVFQNIFRVGAKMTRRDIHRQNVS